MNGVDEIRESVLGFFRCNSSGLWGQKLLSHAFHGLEANVNLSGKTVISYYSHQAKPSSSMLIGTSSYHLVDCTGVQSLSGDP